jgi:hypothetical protein
LPIDAAPYRPQTLPLAPAGNPLRRFTVFGTIFTDGLRFLLSRFTVHFTVLETHFTVDSPTGVGPDERGSE